MDIDTIADALKQGALHLLVVTHTPLLESEILLAHVLHFSRGQLC
jgi:hypothetical protein